MWPGGHRKFPIRHILHEIFKIPLSQRAVLRKAKELFFSFYPHNCFGSYFLSSFQIVQSVKALMFAPSTVLPIYKALSMTLMGIIGLLELLTLMLGLMKTLNVA